MGFAADELIDLDRYPIDRPGSQAWRALAARARADLETDGMFTLPGFLRPGVAEAEAPSLAARAIASGFTHARDHNIYFADPPSPELKAHPAFATFTTVNHTLCYDEIGGGPVGALYRYPPLAAFLAATMGKTGLYPMEDPLAAANVMAYEAGEALNWHFDRSEFTTTLLLQRPEAGGRFEYRPDLRTGSDPNYDGVAALIEGRDPAVRSLDLDAGALNVFRGRNTAHRVTPVEGRRARVVAVLSYFDRPGVAFTEDERVGFYGRPR